MLDGNATLILNDAAGQVRTRMERLVCGIPQREDCQTVLCLVKRIADRMYYENLQNGRWPVDIGMCRPSLCDRDGHALPNAMKDRNLTTEGANDK